MTFPRALLPKNLMEAIDAHAADINAFYWEITCKKEDFESVWSYLTEVKKIPESLLSRYGEAGEMCIEYDALPF